MKLKKQILLICLIMVIEIPFNNLHSQNVQSKPSRQSSFEAFSKGNYEKAYNEFRELLKTYSKDPLYKYYAGVCLIKLNSNPGEAADLLQQALQGAGNVKTLPSDGLFYLGRAQQMSGKYTEAAESFNLFTNQVGKKTARELGVTEFLQQCAQKKGQITDSEVKQETIVKNEKADSGTATILATVKEPVNKTGVSENLEKVNLPVNYDIIMDEAVNLQFKADSVNGVVNGQKQEIEKLTGTDKSALRAKIIENEKLALSLQASADQKYRQAQAAINPKQDTTIHPAASAVTTENKINKDSNEKAGNNNNLIPEKQFDTVKPVTPPIRTKEEVFAVFEVFEKPVNDPKEKILIDSDVPAGLIYRIQMAVFRNPVPPSYFKGITPIYGFKIPGTDKTNYYAGMFRRSADAVKALAAVKARGFKDAFVTALSDKKPVSSDRATLMEKEWSKKPLFVREIPIAGKNSDTIPPALLFRVEVTRSQKPLKEDIVEGMRKMAGSRGLDIQSVDEGKLAYLIGKFITFETASEYADLLNRNGYREAHVVAWLGKKEISIETAKQLFDNLK